MKTNKYFQVAISHSSSIKTGFLSTLGIPFLSTLYKAIDKCPHSCLITKKGDSNNITGFISGAISVKKMYKWIIFRYGLQFFFLVIIQALNPKFLKKIIETLFYSLKKDSLENSASEIKLVDAELLSMAVSEDARGQGIGGELIEELDSWLLKKSVKVYKVVTFSEDKISNGFYLKNGFALERSFKHHENIINEYLKKS